ncbi:MAG: hypothetical protein HY903_02555 [Deltaproteobacteria bacterium]|nr:hypothetical protein [Deltaproteobacteria bacterium]
MRVYVTPYAKGAVVTFYHQQHVDLFGLKCTNCHREENCNTCHDLQKTVAKKKSMQEVHAICAGCHEKDECGRCHADKERPGFSHASTGWPLSRYHDTLSCRACHPTGKPIARLNRDCVGCHAGFKQGKFRHAVTGVQLDETHAGLECSDCHVDLKFAKDPSCTGCHDDKRDFRKMPPGRKIKLK